MTLASPTEPTELLKQLKPNGVLVAPVMAGMVCGGILTGIIVSRTGRPQPLPVYGLSFATLALLVLATWMQKSIGNAYRLNALLSGISLGLASIPVIFSLAEDALTSVPRAYSQAALALGASRWRTTADIVLPAALPGVFAGARAAHADAAAELGEVEAVHRLAEFEHHVVGDVDDVVDRPHAGSRQPLRQPREIGRASL